MGGIFLGIVLLFRVFYFQCESTQTNCTRQFRYISNQSSKIVLSHSERKNTDKEYGEKNKNLVLLNLLVLLFQMF
jgi:hypothetical protein